MDHVKKLVYTIVGCLTIVSLTFTICTKIGHCADSSNVPIEFNGLPYRYGDGIGAYDSISHSLVLNCLDDAITRYGNNYTSGSPVLVTNGSNGSIHVLFGATNNYTSDGSYYIIRYARSYMYNPNGTFNNSFDNARFGIQINQVLETINGTTYYKANSSAEYILWVYNPSNYVTDGGIQIFSNVDIPTGPIGHSKGGVLSNYIDSDDLIEQDSSLPSVDIIPPTDTFSNPAWYQKILNGIGKINQSIQGGVLTIGDYIGMLKESVENGIAWITEEPDNEIISDNIEPYLAQNDLISGFNSSKTSIQGVYTSVTNVTAKTRSQMVWDIPFNLPSMSQTFHARIDFGWYENIRSTFEPFLNMFLCVGFLFSFIRSIPGILHGNSGEGDT